MVEGSQKNYGEKYCSQVFEAWLPLAYIISIWGKKFNSGYITSKHLIIKIGEVLEATTKCCFFISYGFFLP
jgi:hypothetical protein